MTDHGRDAGDAHGGAAGDAAVADALTALRSPDLRARRAALEALAAAELPVAEAVATAVVDCLGTGPKALQRRAADVLRLTADAARPAVAARLRTAVAAPEVPRRWAATYALGQLGIIEPSLVPSLLEALASGDGDQRWAAAAMMVACGRRYADDVVPALCNALRATSPELRKMALYVLRDLAPGGADVATALLVAMDDADAGVRLAALSALSRVTPRPDGVCAEVLRLAREDPDPGVRRAAVSALGFVGAGVAAADAMLTEALTSSDAGTRRAAEAARRRLATE